MKRYVPGLSDTARDSPSEVPDGIFLVRLDGAQHRWQAQKRFYLLRLSILEPKPFTGRSLVSRLYCTPYLTCPRRYRHGYLDGWQEKDVRAAMLFGRCFEQAVAAYSVTKIQQQSYLSSGHPVRTWN